MKKTIVILSLIVIAVLIGQVTTQNQGRVYTGALSVRYANEGVTGTTVNKLAKLTGAPSTAIITATTDTEGIIGVVVAGAGAAGSADIAFKGKALCVFDSATTAGHYVSNDTSTAGDCMDAGATYPTSGQVIGVVTSTNGGAGTYEVDLTLGQPQAGGTGGGGGESVIAIGALPGTCTDGTAFSFTDSIYRVVCDPANTFNYFYGGYFVTPPSSAGWTWDNQDSAVLDSTNGYEYAYFPRSGLAHVSVRYKAAPATPYFVIAGYLWNLGATPPGNNGNNLDVNFGIFVRDGDDGKIIAYTFGVENATPLLAETWRWTNSTTRSTVHTQSSGANVNTLQLVGSRSPIWMAIADDGTTNLTFWWSIDRQHWELFDTWAREDFMTGGPTQIGWGAYNGNSPQWDALIDWAEGSGASP